MSLGCSETFIRFAQLLKIPVISTAGERYSENYRQYNIGHMRWKEPRSEEFSKILNDLLVKQDWFEVVVLYDGEKQNFKPFKITAATIQDDFLEYTTIIFMENIVKVKNNIQTASVKKSYDRTFEE